MSLENLKKHIQDEKKGWERIQEIRGEFESDPIKLFNEVNVDSKEQALERASHTIHNLLETLGELDMDYNDVEPGHGVGHLTRDYVNSLILSKNLDVDQRQLFIGSIAGVMHDSGCTLVPRYHESQTTIRHAEAGALLLDSIAEKSDLSKAEKILIAYAIAAHTHYLKPSEIKCSDGETRTIKPYTDLDKNKNPLFGIWLARWVDRLDINGPAFPGRHYLTLHEKHEDFDGKDFSETDYPKAMRPLLRTREERGNDPQTMLEHLVMFANSQNNESPYGKHDFGEMINLRDSHKERLYRIIDSVQQRKNYSQEDKQRILKAWNSYLINNIEPTPKAIISAGKLESRFKKLDEDAQQAWCNGFLTTMKQYQEWAEEKLEQIMNLTSPKKFPVKLPTITGNVKEIIIPHKEWTNLINSY